MKGIILAGGNGTRLWPISRTLMPKQFVKLLDNKSLFQLTVERNSQLCDKVIIVSNVEQYFLTLDQLEELTADRQSHLTKNSSLFILEPIGRNTAPAIALACMSLDKEEIVLITPSDHLIKKEDEYRKAVQAAEGLAKDNYLVTFGIKPTQPNTGYGYIEAKPVISNSSLVIGMDVVKFHEKPDLKTAEKYLQTDNRSTNCYFWNSGIFMFKAGVYLEELQKYSPEIYETSKTAFNNAKQITNNQIRITYEFMSVIPENSIDYAVMERSGKVKVFPSDIGWSDLGDFDSLSKELSSGSSQITHNPSPIEIDSTNNFIISNKLVSTVNVDNLIIVDTDDALLISKKGSSQKVKQIVNKLKTQNPSLITHHSTIHRPWGTYTVLEDSIGYKIKRIEVKPGKRLSLQKHCYRNEHWIVISGTATVTVEDKTYLVKSNESTYIKMGEVHRLANEEKIPVVLIEAQVGQYTGEDDIVRIEDDYDRIKN